ncbi:MAG: hypothetical protein MZV70_05785 [Desulfobacterales bacterium]|nr:hypothetical protein [Desulfobacterales bacterium]
MLKAVWDYMNKWERGRIEDAAVLRGKDFAVDAAARGFLSAASSYGLTVREAGPFPSATGTPSPRGSMSLFRRIAGEGPGRGFAPVRSSFPPPFSLQAGAVSEPILLQGLRRRDPGQGDTPRRTRPGVQLIEFYYPYLFAQAREMELYDKFLASPELKDNFTTAFFQIFRDGVMPEESPPRVAEAARGAFPWNTAGAALYSRVAPREGPERIGPGPRTSSPTPCTSFPPPPRATDFRPCWIKHTRVRARSWPWKPIPSWPPCRDPGFRPTVPGSPRGSCSSPDPSRAGPAIPRFPGPLPQGRRGPAVRRAGPCIRTPTTRRSGGRGRGAEPLLAEPDDHGEDGTALGPEHRPQPRRRLPAAGLREPADWTGPVAVCGAGPSLDAACDWLTAPSATRLRILACDTAIGPPGPAGHPARRRRLPGGPDPQPQGLPARREDAGLPVFADLSSHPSVLHAVRGPKILTLTRLRGAGTARTGLERPSPSPPPGPAPGIRGRPGRPPGPAPDRRPRLPGRPGLLLSRRDSTHAKGAPAIRARSLPGSPAPQGPAASGAPPGRTEGSRGAGTGGAGRSVMDSLRGAPGARRSGRIPEVFDIRGRPALPSAWTRLSSAGSFHRSSTTRRIRAPGFRPGPPGPDRFPGRLCGPPRNRVPGSRNRPAGSACWPPWAADGDLAARVADCDWIYSWFPDEHRVPSPWPGTSETACWRRPRTGGAGFGTPGPPWRDHEIPELGVGGIRACRAGTFHLPLLRSLPDEYEVKRPGGREPGSTRRRASFPDVQDRQVRGGTLPPPGARPGRDRHSRAACTAAHARAALEAGLAVVLEKPFAASVRGSGRPWSARRRPPDRPLAVFHNRRWDADFLTLARAPGTKAALGEISEAEFRWERYPPDPSGTAGRSAPDRDPGSCGTWVPTSSTRPPGSSDPSTGCRRTSRPSGPALPRTTGSTRCSAPGRGGSSCTRAVLAPDPGFHYRIHGAAATFRTFGEDGQEAVLRSGGVPGGPGWGTMPGAGLLSLPDGTGERLDLSGGDWREFYRGLAAALDGRGPLPVDPSGALETLRLMEAAKASSETGRRIILG